MRLIVTRPLAQAKTWVDALREAGFDAAALPLIDIAGPGDPAKVAEAWADLAQAALVFFVSPSAVEWFFRAAPPGSTWPRSVRAGSPGPGTTAALIASGVPAEQVAAPDADSAAFDSQAFWRKVEQLHWRGTTVLVVRGEGGRDWLADQLGAAGAQVRFVAAYRRRAPVLTDDGATLLNSALADPQGHLWLFSSSEAIDNLRGLAPAANWSRSLALATHARIAQTARSAGFASVVECAPALASVIGAIKGRSIQSTAP